MTPRALDHKLRAAGVVPTRQRRRIAAIMLDAPRHLSAEQVLAEVNRTEHHVSKATVYNTLRLLTAHGLLREVIVDPNRVFYDSTVAAHHHFYNTTTGELTDIPADRLTVSGLPPPPTGTETAGMEVTIRLRARSGAGSGLQFPPTPE